jgi:hypothetical protein
MMVRLEERGGFIPGLSIKEEVEGLCNQVSKNKALTLVPDDAGCVEVSLMKICGFPNTSLLSYAKGR